MINYFKLSTGIPESEQIDPITKAVFIKIHENIADLLTSLLVFSEEELLQAKGAGDLDLSSFMSKDQLSLAHFYCQNHKTLTENFMKKLVSHITAQKNNSELQRRIS